MDESNASTELYLNRSLTFGDLGVKREDFLLQDDVFVVLGEPGSGKSTLMEKIASRIGVHVEDATILKSDTNSRNVDSIVVDGLDELPRFDAASIRELIVKVKETNAKHVIFSCRSSTWDFSISEFLFKCFDIRPTLAVLQPLSLLDQRLLFAHYQPSHDFADFKNRLDSLHLGPLLGNPQFLILFAKTVYLDSGSIHDINSLFEMATKELAREANRSIPSVKRPDLATIIEKSSEIFAKLLLSGKVGVSNVDEPENVEFPNVTSLTSFDDYDPRVVLDTKLFKPFGENFHVPVHRTVAEYCTARYLIDKLTSSSSPVTINRCMALLAPNSVVRNDLRGLLGWIATLGFGEIERRAVEVDPYSVFTHGDPTKLSNSCKVGLLQLLKSFAASDPFFRQADVARHFPTSGFFDDAVVAEIKTQISDVDVNSSLKELYLELIAHSEFEFKFESEIRAIVRDPTCSVHARSIGFWALLNSGKSTACDFGCLVDEHTHESLRILSRGIRGFGIEGFSLDDILSFLRSCEIAFEANPSRTIRFPRISQLIKHAVHSLDMARTERVLDRLTAQTNLLIESEPNLRKNTKLHATSKVVGCILDHYFGSFANGTPPKKIWHWTKNLFFDNQTGISRSESVMYLLRHDESRRGVQLVALQGVSNSTESVALIRTLSPQRHSHAGLQLTSEDRFRLIDWAFENDNVFLWEALHRPHTDSTESNSDDLRKKMRRQANEKSQFMMTWWNLERRWRLAKEEYDATNWRIRRQQRRWVKQEKQVVENNTAFFREHKLRIENGEDVNVAVWIAETLVERPQELTDYQTDVLLILNNVLVNSFPHIQHQLPSVKRFAHFHAESKHPKMATVLLAACMSTLKHRGSLDQVPLHLLRILIVETQHVLPGVDNDSRKQLTNEILRLAFTREEQKVEFVVSYIEEQLKVSGLLSPYAYPIIEFPEFKKLVCNRSLDWIIKYELNLKTVARLFDYAITAHSSSEIETVIDSFLDNGISRSRISASDETAEKNSNFWNVRRLFFKPTIDDTSNGWLRGNKKLILYLDEYVGEFNYQRFIRAGWPKLSAEKIFAILDAFVDDWKSVELPSVASSSDSEEIRAYRFLISMTYAIHDDKPQDRIPILQQLIEDDRFYDFHNIAKSLLDQAKRTIATENYSVPSIDQLNEMWDGRGIGSIEDLRALMLDELGRFQVWIRGSSTTPLQIFRENGQHVAENTASDRIIMLLEERLSNAAITLVREPQMARGTKCDITATVTLDGKQMLLPIEVKGQWNREIWSSMEKQLQQKYAVHPNAEGQGIFLVLWYGAHEKVGGVKNHGFSSAEELIYEIEHRMSDEQRKKIDPFVLDLSINGERCITK